jgi:hypothetical protein
MRAFVLVSTCIAALLGLAGTACASTLNVSRAGVLRLTAWPGEVNGVTFTETVIPGGAAYTVSDSAGVAAGRGCAQVSARQAQCVIGQASDPSLGGLNIARVILDLGDRNDTSSVFTNQGYASVEVRGGAGDDRLSGGAVVPTGTAYAAYGGPGDDTIDGIVTNADPVDVDGGPGDDTISTAAGTVGLGSLRGGLGADTFVIRGQVFATIDGGPGPDTITGVATDGRPPTIGQTIFGGFGRDTIDGLGADTIDCGAGYDSYVPYEGQTTISCEAPLS